MKALITILFVIQSQGHVKQVTPQDINYLKQHGCNITYNAKNNYLADNCIQLLENRDKRLLLAKRK